MTKEWKFGRAICTIYRPHTVLNGKLVSYCFDGSDVFRIKEVDRLLEVKIKEDWEPHYFTGELIWYVGMGFDLVASFDNGILKETKEWSSYREEKTS